MMQEDIIPVHMRDMDLEGKGRKLLQSLVGPRLMATALQVMALLLLPSATEHRAMWGETTTQQPRTTRRRQPGVGLMVATSPRSPMMLMSSQTQL